MFSFLTFHLSLKSFYFTFPFGFVSTFWLSTFKLSTFKLSTFKLLTNWPPVKRKVQFQKTILYFFMIEAVLHWHGNGFCISNQNKSYNSRKRNLPTPQKKMTAIFFSVLGFRIWIWLQLNKCLIEKLTPLHNWSTTCNKWEHLIWSFSVLLVRLPIYKFQSK